MSKKFVLLLFLLVFASVSLSTITFTFPEYDGQYYNSSSYTIGWLWNNDTGDWKCFKISESLVNGSFSDSTIVSDINNEPVNFSSYSSKGEAVYYYKVDAYTDKLCLSTSLIDSANISLIVDTSPPSVSSKSPSGNNEPLTGSNITLIFDEPMNTSSFSISSGSSNITFSSPVWSDSDQTVTIPYTATNQGETFVVTFKASDLAGNWVTDSMQFTTLVK